VTANSELNQPSLPDLAEEVCPQFPLEVPASRVSLGAEELPEKTSEVEVTLLGPAELENCVDNGEAVSSDFCRVA
jgi:hypothetical protein